MAIINYQFADGHFEEIEVSEEFKREYEEMERKERNINRKETRRHQSLEKLLEYDDFLIESKDMPIPDIIVLREETDKIREAMTTFTDKQRTVFTLHFIDGLSKTEISRKLHIDRKTVAKHLESAIKKVKKFL